MAHAPTVQDHPVGEVGPLRRREELHEVGLDLLGRGLLGPAEASREPADVGVDGDPRDVEGVAEDDVGGLAAYAGECDEFV